MLLRLLVAAVPVDAALDLLASLLEDEEVDLGGMLLCAARSAPLRLSAPLCASLRLSAPLILSLRLSAPLSSPLGVSLR